MYLFSNIFRGLGLTSVALLLALTLVAAVPNQAPQQDTDRDGLTDRLEKIYKTDPNQPDSDRDGLTDGEEVNTHRTNPLEQDTDEDGLTDGEEVNTHRTNPLEQDTDEDGLTDGEEVNTHNTNPLDEDSDGDGLTDYVEIAENNSKPLWADTDGDGLTDGEEVNTHRTHPLKADSDDDGLSDADEVKQHKTNPNSPDSDKDGLPDSYEIDSGNSDPNKADTDNDGLSDSDEVKTYKTAPNLADTDGDGLPDGDEENKYYTDPLKVDSDGDNLSDFDELTCYQTNPTKYDSKTKGQSDDLSVQGPCPINEATSGDSQADLSETLTKEGTDPTKVAADISPSPTPDTQDAAGNSKGGSEMSSGTDAGATDETTAGSVVTPEPKKQGLFGFFGLDGPWKWALIAVGGVIGICVVALPITFFLWWRSKGEGLQEPPAGPSAQRAVQSRKDAKATELRNLSAILSRQAQELRELSFLDAVVSNPPSVNGDMSALLDREQVVLSAVQTLEGLAGPTSERRLAMTRLVESLEEEGLKTAALKRAVGGTPATVLHLLLAALQELNEQLGTSLESTPDYVRQVRVARELCNREINDAVARRLPLGLLDVAGEVLQQAQTAPQQRAAQQVTDGILAAVYRQYFPRLRRG